MMSAFNPHEERALAAFDQTAMLSYLCDLIAIPSLSGEESAAQEHVAAQMLASGLDVDRWALDFTALQAHPDCSMEVERERGLGVVGSLGQGEGPSLILNGHTDVVPTGDPADWHYPPWQGTVARGRVYGRGALDMKGPLCCALFAAKAIVDAGIALHGRLLIHSVIGEEDGGVGTLAALLRGHTAGAAIVLEPTALAIAPAQAGALNFRITVPGRSAHGAMRKEGVSALEKFIPIHQALLDFEAERNAGVTDPLFASYEWPFALTMGTIRGGDWASNVPAELVCEGRFGVAPGEDLAGAKAAFERVVAETAAADPWLRDHAPAVTWWGAQFAPARIAPGHPLVEGLASACRDAGGDEPEIRGMTYGADMRLLVNTGGIPTVLFGPGDIRQAHRPDEYVPIAELVRASRTLILAILRFCGHG